MKRMPLKEALELWQMKTPLDGEHLEDSALRGMIRGHSDDSIFSHLATCNFCRQRLWRLQAATPLSEKYAEAADMEDFVLPLAASEGLPQQAVWMTADEKYKIEFRRILSDKAQRAVLIVRVQPPFNFAGRTIVVRDAGGGMLLHGQVGRDGKVVAILEDIDSLVLKKITVSEG